MNRLMPRVIIVFLTFVIGIYVHSETIRLVDYLWQDTTDISVHTCPELVDPIAEKACDRIINAWHAGTLSGRIPSYVQIRCLGVDEG